MAESVKLSDGRYIDATGIYDTTQKKTQQAFNKSVASSLGGVPIVNTYTPTIVSGSAPALPSKPWYKGSTSGYGFRIHRYRNFTAAYNAIKGTVSNNVAECATVIANSWKVPLILNNNDMYIFVYQPDKYSGVAVLILAGPSYYMHINYLNDSTGAESWAGWKQVTLA